MNYLEQLVKGYLHEDFDLYGDEWGALAVFVSEYGGTVAVENLVSDIDDLLSAAGGDDGKIADQLRAWGIGIVPSPEEETYRGWLGEVRKRAAQKCQ
ncbi:contact-dependent growth inhibition system immunity protein [Williamsia sp. Leaf354]|uniref:contact-dependent growth inhibition system immunity protein n=1 Tax=Williamsia sp. Leaf354 TaxID=1736349 RepID=UPI0006FC67DB|nr:contact-dependent growth inhibition system immunity protein [Williamsia sp. Leaf354]